MSPWTNCCLIHLFSVRGLLKPGSQVFFSHSQSSSITSSFKKITNSQAVVRWPLATMESRGMRHHPPPCRQPFGGPPAAIDGGEMRHLSLTQAGSGSDGPWPPLWVGVEASSLIQVRQTFRDLGESWVTWWSGDVGLWICRRTVGLHR